MITPSHTSLCLSHRFLTFTGHLRRAVIEINAVLSAQIMICTVLQTGITGGLQTRTGTLKIESLSLRTMHSYSLDYNEITEIPGFGWVRWAADLPRHDRLRSLRGEGCCWRSVSDAHRDMREAWAYTESGLCLRNNAFMVGHLPVHVNRQFGGVCNTSDGASKTQMSTKREERARRKGQS